MATKKRARSGKRKGPTGEAVKSPARPGAPRLLGARPRQASTALGHDLADQARSAVANRYGQAFAAKATDQLCRALGGTPFAAKALLGEAFASRVSPIILELRRGTADAADVRHRAAALAGSNESIPDLAWRLGRIQVLRDRFAQQVAGMKADLDRRSKPVVAARLRALAAHAAPISLVETCWLNGSMRAALDPKSIAEVAADSTLDRLDLPRPLRPEVEVTINTVGAAKFQSRSGLTGEHVTVAVIDFEVDVQHPALRPRVIQKLNRTNEPWGAPAAHGTAVAGIIAAADPSFGGMAPGVTITNYKVMCAAERLNADDFGGALAIQQALEDGAQIANCSWGTGPAGEGSSREAIACNTAWALGLVIVKSAGNSGPGASTLTAPADADGVIVVGATTRDGLAVPDYSSRGPAVAKRRPHLVAPGGGNFDFIHSCHVGGGFGPVGWGTSYATAHVSGLAALLLARTPGLSPDEVRQQLLDSCTPLPGVDANVQGRGLATLAAVT